MTGSLNEPPQLICTGAQNKKMDGRRPSEQPLRVTCLRFTGEIEIKIENCPHLVLKADKGNDQGMAHWPMVPVASSANWEPLAENQTCTQFLYIFGGQFIFILLTR